MNTNARCTFGSCPRLRNLPSDLCREHRIVLHFDPRTFHFIDAHGHEEVTVEEIARAQQALAFDVQMIVPCNREVGRVYRM